MDVVDVIVGNKVIAENEPLVTAQAPDDLGFFSKFTSDLSIFKASWFLLASEIANGKTIKILQID